MRLKKQLVELLNRRPQSRTAVQIRDFVSKTEIAFSACVVEKTPDGTFSTPCEYQNVYCVPLIAPESRNKARASKNIFRQQKDDVVHTSPSKDITKKSSRQP